MEERPRRADGRTGIAPADVDLDEDSDEEEERRAHEQQQKVAQALDNFNNYGKQFFKKKYQEQLHK